MRQLLTPADATISAARWPRMGAYRLLPLQRTSLKFSLAGSSDTSLPLHLNFYLVLYVLPRLDERAWLQHNLSCAL